MAQSNNPQIDYGFPLPKTDKERLEFEQSLKQMTEPAELEEEDKRLQRGYSHKEWATVTLAHKQINDFINNLLPDFLADLLSVGYNMESEEGKAAFKKYDLKFRDYMRRVWIKKYPVSRDSTKELTRKRLLGLFTMKVQSALKKN